MWQSYGANVKNVLGRAWHNTGKVLGAVDHAATVGTRLFGAVAPFLGEGALSHGIRAIDRYSSLRNQVQSAGRGVRQIADGLEGVL